ncbi:MAG: LytTR family DNA-binding domain-containing protein, partial [Bacteroidota bacterium]
EKLRIQKEELLFVKSSENYVEIYYNKDNEVQHEIFRNTLGEINRQAAFLKQCHRSYLVNISNIKNIKGNSQNAKIEFHLEGLDIPLSNTYYKSIKSSLGVQPKI